MIPTPSLLILASLKSAYNNAFNNCLVEKKGVEDFHRTMSALQSFLLSLEPQTTTEITNALSDALIRDALIGLKLHKAADVHGLPAERLKPAVHDPVLFNALAAWIRHQAHHTTHLPTTWRDIFMVGLPKVPAPKLPSHLRFVVLSEILNKLYRRFVFNAISHFVAILDPRNMVKLDSNHWKAYKP